MHSQQTQEKVPNTTGQKGKAGQSHFTPTRMAAIKETENSEAGESWNRNLQGCGWERKVVSVSRKMADSSSKGSAETYYITQQFHIYPKDLQINSNKNYSNKNCTPIFIAALDSGLAKKFPWVFHQVV